MFHQDGSYDVVKELGNGHVTMEHRNPDGSEYTDDWHCELVGNEVIVFEAGRELSRHLRWLHPQLLANHQREYQERYAGKERT